MIPKIRVWRKGERGYSWMVDVLGDGVYAFTGWVTAITFATRVAT